MASQPASPFPQTAADAPSAVASPPLPTVGIVGLGLIGGSLGLDLCRQGYRVLGVSRRLETCQRAVARGAVTAASQALASLAVADVIVLCTPLDALLPTVQQLLPHLSPETVLTDVGSVKQPVVATIAPLWPWFVGGHPMAGTTEQGIDAALENLFLHRPYVLTPTAQTPVTAVAQVERLARALGAAIYHCDPAEHDQAVAWISHLPVMVSTGLFQAWLREPSPTVRRLAQQLASSGFCDTSRVGGGNPELGTLMARYNREPLLASLRAYRQGLDQIIDAIEAEDWAAIAEVLHQGHQARPAFLE